MTPLEARWVQLWTETRGNSPDPSKWKEWLDLHREPQRHYHTDRHIEECFALFDGAISRLQEPRWVAWALFFHDAVYDPQKSDNEEQSAALAAPTLREAGLGESAVAAVQSLILSTKSHQKSDQPDSPYLLDIDLAILSAPEPRFFEYEGQIRSEYSFVPLSFYGVKRAEILETFLSRPKIYLTEFLGAAREERAISNLKKSIAFLKRGEIPKAP